MASGIKMKPEQHREQFELSLCRRDYELMIQHHPELLDDIERAIGDGVTAQEIKRWALGVVSEYAIVQRCYNAARYAEAMDG